MKESQIVRQHLLGGLEGGAWGGFFYSLLLLYQFGGYLHAYLLLTLWCVIIGGVIGGAIGILYAKRLTRPGAFKRAMIGGGCVLLLAAFTWLTSSDDGAVTPPTWPQALFSLAESVVLLGMLPGVMAGLERGKADGAEHNSSP